MSTVMQQAKERRKIHPQKFMLWIAMASISMAFAGLTSGYMVREAQGNWRYYNMPSVFTYSTIVIALSSITMIAGVRAFKARQIPRYRMLISVTVILGLLFGALQFTGFYQLYHQLQ